MVALLLAATAPSVGWASAATVRAFDLPSAGAGGSIAEAIGLGLGDEWLVTRDGQGGYALVSATPDGALSVLPAAMTADNGGFPAIVYAQPVTPGPWQEPGDWWALGHNSSLYALSFVGSATAVAPTTAGDDRDMAVGPDQNLYVADHAGTIDQYAITDAPSATLHQFSAGSGVFPDSIVTAGGELWFSDDSGTLYSMTTDGVVSPHGADNISAYPQSMVFLNGRLWAVSYSASDGYNNRILEIDPGTGNVLAVFSSANSGIVNTPGLDITSITGGPGAGANLWFPEAGANQIGALNAATGQVTDYQLPANASLPIPGPPWSAGAPPYPIAEGPWPDGPCCGSVWFAARDATGQRAVVGEISGGDVGAPAVPVLAPPAAPTPTPGATAVGRGTLTTARSVSVVRRGLAQIRVACRGTAGATCTGRLSLTRAPRRVTQRQTSTAVTRRSTFLGSVHYSLRAGARKALAVRLSRRVITLVTATANRRLKVLATITPSHGHAVVRSVTLVVTASRAVGDT